MFSSNLFQGTRENNTQTAKSAGLAEQESSFFRKTGESKCRRKVAGHSGAVRKMK